MHGGNPELQNLGSLNLGSQNLDPQNPGPVRSRVAHYQTLQDERGRAVRLTYACLLSPEKRQKKQKRRNNEKLKTEKS